MTVTNIANEKKMLLQKLMTNYEKSLNDQILKICLIYITLSISWNFAFQWFNLPFSRADLSVLLLIFALLSIVFLFFHIFKLPSRLKTHIVLSIVILVVIGLYFGSGYSEGWSYFLLIPIINSLYGNRFLSISYSIIGLLCLSAASVFFQLTDSYVVDYIDVSNRILLYIIVATFSYLLLSKLNMLYNKQVTTVVESVERTLEQVVQSFIVAMEAKDLYTFGHSERVSQYAVAIAKQLPEFQDKHSLKKLRLSGLLHDIGKINVPEQILTKPTNLTNEEYEIIKTHTVIGAQMVEKVDGLEDLKCGVLYHHERWDGKGYPAGLKGNDIPLEARILAVADALDAVTSTRAYRDELTIEEAFQELEKGRETQFDPHLYPAIQAAKQELLSIYSNAHDPFDEFKKLTDLL